MFIAAFELVDKFIFPKFSFVSTKYAYIKMSEKHTMQKKNKEVISNGDHFLGIKLTGTPNSQSLKLPGILSFVVCNPVSLIMVF